MTDIVPATHVHGGYNRQAIYLDGKCVYQDSTADFDDINIPADKAIGSFNHDDYDIRQMGLPRFPSTLEKLKRLDTFAKDVRENKQTWRRRIKQGLKTHQKDYIMTDEVDEFFGVEDGEGMVVIGLFSQTNVKKDKTPLGETPLLELDHEHSVSGAGPAAYRLTT